MMNFIRFIACDENKLVISVIIELPSWTVAKETLGMALAFFQYELNPSSFLKGVWQSMHIPTKSLTKLDESINWLRTKHLVVGVIIT